jgi:hypothetical protein
MGQWTRSTALVYGVYGSIKTAGSLWSVELVMDFMKRRVIFHSNLGCWRWIGRLRTHPLLERRLRTEHGGATSGAHQSSAFLELW